MKTIVCCLMLLMVLPVTLFAQEEVDGSQTNADKADRQPSLSDAAVNEPIGEVEPLVEPVADSQSAEPVASNIPAASPMTTEPASILAPTAPVEAYSQMPQATAMTGWQVMPSACPPLMIGAEVTPACHLGVPPAAACQPCCQPCVEPARCCRARTHCQPRCRRIRLFSCRR